MTAAFEPLTTNEKAAVRRCAAASRERLAPAAPVPLDAADPETYRDRVRGEPSHVWRYRDADGHLLFAVARWDWIAAGGEAEKTIRPLTWDGAAWRPKAAGKPWPLYGLDRLANRPAAGVLVVEGEKACDAAATLFPQFVAVTSPGGANAASSADWAPLRGRDVTLCPDADEPGEKYVREVAGLLRDAGAASVRLLPPERLASLTIRGGTPVRREGAIPKGWDLADALDEGWTAELVEELINDADFLPMNADLAGRSPERPRFEVDETGVYRIEGRSDEEARRRFVCTPVRVVAETRDASGGGWGLVVSWPDPDGRQHEDVILRGRLSANDGADVLQTLADGGVKFSPNNRRSVLEYLATTDVQKRARRVERTGWHEAAGGLVFVLGQGTIIGEAGDEWIVYEGSAHVRREKSGSLKEWQEEVASRCVGNSRLIVAVSAAFAAPLLTLTNEQGGGIHFVGGSSIGKSTALHVAASVFGMPVSTWRATDNGLEGLAIAHNDLPLVLDELGEIEPRQAGCSAYLLANGQGKTRGRADGSHRNAREFRTLFLSTGELTLSDKMREDGRSRTARAGQAVRMLDVPADAGAKLGLFEDLQGAASAAGFADAIRQAAKSQRGTAGPEFLLRLVGDLDAVLEAVRGHRKEFGRDHVPADADGQVQRAADRFALIGAAGELAADLGIVPWAPGEALKAAGRCLEGWIEVRGGCGAGEVLRGVQAVREFIAAHGADRFDEWSEGGPPSRLPARDRVGFYRAGDPGDERAGWYVLAPCWSTVCGPGANPKDTAARLAADGLLAPGTGGKVAKVVRPPGMGGGTRCYHLLPNLLAEPPGGDE